MTLLQGLPTEILTQIASYIPTEHVGEFGRTCQSCYYAVLPFIWHHLTLNDASDLSLLAKRLETNNEWHEKASYFVKDVSLSRNNSCESLCKFSSTDQASMFGIATPPLERTTPIRSNSGPSISASSKVGLAHHHEQIDVFGKRLLKTFPHLSNIELDYDEAVEAFLENDSDEEDSSSGLQTRKHNSNSDDDCHLPYYGTVTLTNYKADNTDVLTYLLNPFRKLHHLKLSATAPISLCDDFDDSLLTPNDLHALQKLNFKHLRKLELGYLDSDVDFNALLELVATLPKLKSLTLKWMFPPSDSEFDKLCKLIQERVSLYPSLTEYKATIYHVQFTHA